MLSKRVSRMIGGTLATATVLLSVVIATGNTEAVLRQIPLLERIYTRWVPPTPPAVPEAPPVAAPPVAAPPLTASPVAAAPASADTDSRPISPPEEQAPAVLDPAERKALAAFGQNVRGRLVWSSNRLGNHELFMVDLPDLTVHRLTDNPHVDYFSRFSPDGRQISFVRSRRPWVSFREADAWDVYVMNVDGSGERRLAEHASHPTWTPDGSALIFQRGNAISKMDLASGAESVIYDGSSPATEGSRIGDPGLRADGLLALTVNRRGQRVGVLDVGAGVFTRLSSDGACEITWTPDGQTLLWIGNQGHGGTRVMRGRVGVDEDVLIDLPGDYSHEYFPRISSDGQWLIWAAAAEGHEHDRADYEIFVWKLGTPWEHALRLTYSAANDQWPDLYVVP